MGRGAKAAALALVLLGALAGCGWPDRAAAALVALLLVRCHLSVSEVWACVHYRFITGHHEEAGCVLAVLPWKNM